ncbi:MAG: DNRLRE domain-containing protein [Planctomycetota bacterium]
MILQWLSVYFHVSCRRIANVLASALMAVLALGLIGASQPATRNDAFLSTVADGPDHSLQRIEFQQGANNYKWAVDSEIWALAPNTILESNPNASSDANNDGGESQVLLRFDKLIGDQPGQIPSGSHVVSARLLVSAFDQGSTVNLHRMLVPFSCSVTWNSMVDGVSADDAEASRHKDSFTFGKIAANTSTVIFDVTDTVSAWVQGSPNHGWVFINTGGNGWDFYSSEFDDIQQRPKLIVEFEAVPEDSIDNRSNDQPQSGAEKQ